MSDAYGAEIPSTATNPPGGLPTDGGVDHCETVGEDLIMGRP